MHSFLPAFFLIGSNSLSRFEDLLNSPLLLGAWGLALLLMLLLPALVLRLRRRRVRRTYQLNPLAVPDETAGGQHQTEGEDDEYRQQRLAEATR